MTGAIDYLNNLHQICKDADQDCKKCKLGKQTYLKDTLCPRLVSPVFWDKDKIYKMVSKGKKEAK